MIAPEKSPPVSFVLVGTYRREQLEKWILPKGLYNYPILDGDDLPIDRLSAVKELWLFNGKKGPLVFDTEFIGVRNRSQLEDYPVGRGKPHSGKYLLFKAAPKYASALPDAPVIVRADDFAGRSHAIRRQIMEALSAPDAAKHTSIAKYLPPAIATLPIERLHVCEEALQLESWNERAQVRAFSSPLRAVELFAGIGGFRIACEHLGIKTVWANDIDKKAVKVYEDNFGTGEMVAGDINEKLSLVPEHDILLAGFPCQPFSKAGKKMGVDDIRGTLFESIVKILRARNPACFLLENVSNLLSLDKGRHFRTVLAALCALDYHIEWKVFNAANLGLPQHRERILIAGTQSPVARASRLLTQAEADSLKDEDAEAAADPRWWKDIVSIGAVLPKWGKAHAGKYVAVDFLPETDVLPPRKLRDVLDEAPSPAFDFTEETASRIAQSTRVDHYYNGVQLLFNQGGGARMGYTIFGPDGLAPTLTASTSRHYERYFIDGRFRRLTNSEYAKIQGFPADHCKAVSVYDQYKLFGNALPPVLAEWALHRLSTGETSMLPQRTLFFSFG